MDCLYDCSPYYLARLANLRMFFLVWSIFWWIVPTLHDACWEGGRSCGRYWIIFRGLIVINGASWLITLSDVVANDHRWRLKTLRSPVTLMLPKVDLMPSCRQLHARWVNTEMCVVFWPCPTVEGTECCPLLLAFEGYVSPRMVHFRAMISIEH